VLVFVGLLLAGVTEWMDRNADMLPFTLPDILTDTQADGARSTLAVIAQSVIGVTGVMFSMTLVAVSFASGNFGPRLIGNFMRDRGNQWSLGILISTFVYAVVVLRTVQSGIDGGVDQFVPHYSLIMAMLLALLCVFTLIYFVHHVPETINVSRISSGLGNKLERQIRDLVDDSNDDDAKPGDAVDWPTTKANITITPPTSGYIQTCNISRLQTLASEKSWHIEMLPAVGDFVTTATDVFAIWSLDPLSDDDGADLRACFAIGYARTENQNPAFLAEQLVEMAVRALSPGVNDPYTAMDCLNRLMAALTVASDDRGGLSPQQDGRLRTPKLNFETFFAVTFPLCRQYVHADDITRAHALDLLKTLQTTVRSQDRPLIASEIDALTKSD
ncbi:MAG: DUF2254 domain-containing protein, partial [Octadecabacter sp.]